ncbi:TonB-dependent receptor plug domain-containing protein [Leptolyngbya sp. AN02str]|uniref:TonB-dependent receptor plug domain-containing protein n=1 Tax=Leptolyngbya sp. AN02str TaxID=3423363 RepID=UPI003D31306D
MSLKWIICAGHTARLVVAIALWAGTVAIAQAAEVQEPEAITPEAITVAIKADGEAPPDHVSRPAATPQGEPAHLSQAPIAQITGVSLASQNRAIELILQTIGELAPSSPSVTGNAIIIDIPNAVLALPDGDEFSAAQPTEGIALVSMSPLPNNQVRIAITGTDAPPVVNLRTDNAQLVVNIAPGETIAAPAEDEAIQIVVTSEQDGSDYFAPNVSTATRTNTSILDVPQSIQVIPQQVLEDQQTLRIDDALRNVSGVIGSFDAFGPGANLTLRGFSTDPFANGPILRDGFRVYDNLGVQETANLERIEVLRGPSSILYGQNDPGGIINLVTEQPLAEPTYELQLQAGSFGLIRPSLDISGPLTADASLRYRLNAAYQREDGFRDFDTT